MLEYGRSMKYNIIIMALSTLSICFIVAYSLLLKKFVAIKSKATKLIFDNFTLEKVIELQNNEDLRSDQSVHKENFLKFISESRDWAFDYIEDVQKSILKFVEDVDSYIEYFDKYSDVISVERPDYVAMKQISKSYKELKKVLPKEENN
jgi:hypothetical protein